MPEKIIRVSAEDSGFSERINRMGDTMRRAFSNMGLSDILDEADRKFTSLSDKVKFISQELGDLKKFNLEELGEEIDRINSGRGTKAEKTRQINRLERETEGQNRKLDDLIDHLDKFAGRIENEQAQERRATGATSHLETLKEFLRGNFGAGIRRLSGGARGNIVRTLEGIGPQISRSLAATGGVIAAAITGAFLLARRGYEELRDENRLRSRFDLGDDFADTGMVARLGMSRSDFRELALRTSETRRSGFDIERVALERATFMNAFGLDREQFAGLDRFYRAGSSGQNVLDVNQGMDALRTIQTVLVRSDQQGLLGVSKGDFTMLPEKIAQVQSVMQMQFANNERVDANAAVGLIMAGQQIGGRFADERAGEAFGRIDSSIRQPGGPGMRAFIFEMLRRSSPGSSYTDIMAQMEGGASAENLQAILPTISQLPQGEMRRMLLFQLTKNWQDARRLDQAGSLDAMLKSLSQQPITDVEAQQRFGTAQERSDRLTTEWDRTIKGIGNDVSQISKYVAQGAEWLLKHPPSGIVTGYDEKTSKLYSNNDIYKTNTIIQGSPTGNQVQNRK